MGNPSGASRHLLLHRGGRVNPSGALRHLPLHRGGFGGRGGGGEGALGDHHVEVEGEAVIEPAALEAGVHRLDALYGIEAPVVKALLRHHVLQGVGEHPAELLAALAGCGEGQLVLQAGGVLKVVGVVGHGQVGIGVGLAPELAGEGRLAAVGGGVVAGGVAAPVRADDAAGGGDGQRDVFIVGVRALVDLVGGGVHQVVVPPTSGPLALQGVGAGRHGLGLEGLQGEAVAHLVGHHAGQVFLHRQGQHRPQAVADDGQAEVARVQVALLRFRDVKAVRRALGGGVAGQREGGAQVEGEGVGLEPDVARRGRQRHLRAALEAKARAVFQRVDALDGQVQRLRRVQRFEPYREEAVVPERGGGRGGGGGLRGGGETEQGQDEDQCDESMFHGASVFCGMTLVLTGLGGIIQGVGSRGDGGDDLFRQHQRMLTPSPEGEG